MSAKTSTQINKKQILQEKKTTLPAKTIFMKKLRTLFLLEVRKCYWESKCPLENVKKVFFEINNVAECFYF